MNGKLKGPGLDTQPGTDVKNIFAKIFGAKIGVFGTNYILLVLAKFGS
jgi:hypothetical protein